MLRDMCELFSISPKCTHWQWLSFIKVSFPTTHKQASSARCIPTNTADNWSISTKKLNWVEIQSRAQSRAVSCLFALYNGSDANKVESFDRVHIVATKSASQPNGETSCQLRRNTPIRWTRCVWPKNKAQDAECDVTAEKIWKI